MHITQFLAISFAVFTGFANSSPTPRHHHSIKGDSNDDTNLPESKRKPVMDNGDIVLTASTSVIVQSEFPDDSTPRKDASDEDKGRGRLQITNPGDKVFFMNTVVSIEVPDKYADNICSFHFLWGSGDMVHTGKVLLYALQSKPILGETTWNNKPRRYLKVGEFYPGEGEKISKVNGDGNDARFDYSGSEVVVTGMCSEIIPIQGFEMELAYDPDTTKGYQSAWSLNKGLFIRVHKKY